MVHHHTLWPGDVIMKVGGTKRMLDFTALWCGLGLGEVLGEDAGHGRAAVPVGDLGLDDGTDGATLDREGEEKLDYVRMAVAGSAAESGVVKSGRVDASLQRQNEEELDDVCVTVHGSIAESAVVVYDRVDATLLKEVSHRGDGPGPRSSSKRG